ncbi:MAG: type I 3-dehydroquinate dehydratase [Lachnospiraceae bacterium]|jgi:3-dehydroquinate dehydratase-1|nr:type I 3-dehydroquinate dehydratase [Lachnospiraceae bacterium]
MTNVVKLKSVELGAGRPKLAVSVTGCTKEQFEQELQTVLTEGRAEKGWNVDLIEIRMDSFSSVNQREAVVSLLKGLRERNPDIPFLFTYRSKREGGLGELNSEAYGRLLLWAAGSGYIDAVDVEALFDRENACAWIRQIHGTGIPVVASYHDAKKTPQNMDTILQMLSESGGDIVKLAVFARSEEDARHLIAASRRFADLGQKPIISMAMGELGRSTRVRLTETGSAVTFGAVGTPSAPGQIPLKELIPLIKRHEER